MSISKVIIQWRVFNGIYAQSDLFDSGIKFSQLYFSGTKCFRVGQKVPETFYPWDKKNFWSHDYNLCWKKICMGVHLS